MKKFISILLTVALMFSMTATVFASGDKGGVNVPNIGNPDIPEKATDLVERVLGGIQWAGYAIAVGMLLYIGIKYVMSAANEKADLKKGLINYVIGAALLFGTSAILTAIQAWMENVK